VRLEGETPRPDLLLFLFTSASSSRTPLADSRPNDWTARLNLRVRQRAVMARPRRLERGGERERRG
jgi:hypothetical protein